jgi:trimethylamine:corrinoid methyltransferase-like protein
LLGRFEDEGPEMDPAQDEALRDFIARREAVLPDDVF